MKRILILIMGIMIMVITGVIQAQQQQPITEAEVVLTNSTEAAKVANWVRELPSVSAEANHFSVIGGINMVHVNPFMRGQTVSEFYARPESVQAAMVSLQERANVLMPILQAGGLLYLRDVQNFPWGLMEFSPGQMDFRLSDTIVRSVQDNGGYYVGTVMPYAAWDFESDAPSQDEMCLRLMSEDFFYLDGVMDRYNDLDAFIRWLDSVVERYDGDGVNDMPGLSHPVRFWQIHNEPEGDKCGGFRDDVGAFVELMQRSYETIKASCPDCQVMNGGAGIPLWREGEIPGTTFWQEFADAGGTAYLDIIAVHYNHGKVDGGHEADFEQQVMRLRELLGMEKPVWVTEFGVFSEFGGQFMALPENEAGAWYMRFYTVGLASGVSRFFSDTAAFVNVNWQSRQTGQLDVTLFLSYYVNRLLEAKIGAFTEIEKLADGQYRFVVNGQDIYMLWNGVPATLSGTVKVTDMYGNESTLSVNDLMPASLNPILVESMP